MDKLRTCILTCTNWGMVIYKGMKNGTLKVGPWACVWERGKHDPQRIVHWDNTNLVPLYMDAWSWNYYLKERTLRIMCKVVFHWPTKQTNLKLMDTTIFDSRDPQRYQTTNNKISFWSPWDILALDVSILFLESFVNHSSWISRGHSRFHLPFVQPLFGCFIRCPTDCYSWGMRQDAWQASPKETLESFTLKYGTNGTIGIQSWR